MKMIRKIATTVLPIVAMIAMTACSSDSDSGASGGVGSGSTPLATGGFVKEVAKGAPYSTSAPLYTSVQKSQFLIVSNEINGSGNIDSISFRAEDDEVETKCTNVKIQMGHTGLAELTTTYADNIEEGHGSLQTVVEEKDLTFAALTAGDLITIDLDTPFNYNGVDNLVIYYQMSGACDNSIGIVTDSTANRLLHSQNINALTGGLYLDLPNLVMHFMGGVNTQDYGSTLNNSWPFSTQLPHTQNLYTASDINGSGPITGLGFQVNGPTSEAVYVATVKLGHTGLTDLQTVYADNSGDLVTVATNINFTVPAGLAAGDWFWVPLTGSFNYDGTDNLLVDIEVTAATGSTNLRTTAMGNTVRASGSNGADTAQYIDSYAYHAKFRFNGASMDVMTIANGGWALPFNGSNAYRTQILYGAHALGTGGKVSAISFRLKNASSASEHTESTVVLGNTANTVLDDNLSLNIVDSTNVFSGTITIPAGLKEGDWITFPVSGFTYDATKNLVLEVAPNASDTGVSTVISTTNDTVPVGGLRYGNKGADTTIGSSPGQADLRITLDK